MMFSTVAAIAFAGLALIWRRDDLLNTTIKAAMIALSAWGGIDALLAWGFILAPEAAQ